MESQTPPRLPQLDLPVSQTPNLPKVVNPVVKYLAMAIFVLLPFLGFYFGMQYQLSVEYNSVYGRTKEGQIIYQTQNECETRTNSQCSLINCDLVNEGETYAQTCGKYFKKGWVSIDKSLISSPPENGNQTLTSKQQTYTNPKYGFSFQYPSEFSITQDSTEKTQFNYHFDNGDILNPAITIRYKRSVDITKFPQCLPFPQGLDAVPRSGCIGNYIYGQGKPAVFEFTTNNVTARVFHIAFAGDKMTQYKRFVQFDKKPFNDIEFEFDVTGGFSEPIDKILSTLKFLNSDTSLQIINKIASCTYNTSYFQPKAMDLTHQVTSKQLITDTIAVTDTSRGCITLPEDIYPRDKRKITQAKTGSLGYVSNWEDTCGGINMQVDPENCTGDGYEADGEGTVIFEAKSINPDAPDIKLNFQISNPR